MKKNYFNYFSVFIVVLALILRLPLLNGSFWLDEAAQALESTRPLNQQLQIAGDFQPPLLHLIIYFVALFNSSEWWLRSFGALIPGLITLIFTIKIARKLFGEKTALLTGLFLATNSFHIFFSQELRPYSLPAMWASLSWWSLIKNSFSQKNTQNSKNKKLNWVFIVFSILGLFSSYLYPFLLFSQLVYLFWQNPKQLKKISLHFLLIGGGFLPWLPKFIEQFKVGQYLRLQMPGWEDVVSLSQLKSLPLIVGKFFYGVSNLELKSLQTLGLLLLASLLFWQFIKNYWSKTKTSKNFKQAGMTICIWLILPILTAWLVSFFVPVLSPKRVLFCLPAFVILLASLITSYQNQVLKKVWIFVILIINFTGFYNYLTQAELQRENWRSLHQEISTKFNPENTAVVFAFEAPFSPWQWYDKNTFPILTTQNYFLTENNLPNLEKNLKKLEIQQVEYLIVFDYLRDLTDPDDLLIRTIKDLGWQDGGFFDYPNIGLVRIYKKNPVII